MQVYAWGRGEDGQLGLGDASDQLKPRLIECLYDKDVSQVVCGSGHTVVLSKDGNVYTWGRGDDGRLGHGDTGWKHEPRLVTAMKNRFVRQITCGSYHTAAVTDTGELFTWGCGMYGKLGHGNEYGHTEPRCVDSLREKFVMQVACGSRHTVVLVTDRSGAGSGIVGGISSDGGSSACTTQSSASPSSQVASAKITTAGARPPPPRAKSFTAYTNSQVYAWGDRDNGVSGHGDNVDGHQYFPKLLEALVDRGVCMVSACGFHTGAVTEYGEVYTWGEGRFGRLGHGRENNQVEPKLVEDEQMKQRRIVQIACGGFHTAAISDNGELFTWGGGEHGQLGHGNKENQTRPTLVEYLAGTRLSQVTCGWSHTVALTDQGGVWSFGNGDHGKLGHGDTEKVFVPKVVEGLMKKRISHIASFNEHTAALAVPADGIGTVPNTTLLVDFGSLVNNPMCSDITFLVEKQRIHAHRVIIAARCAHFRAMFESGMKECSDGEVQITDSRYEVFMALLRFLYTDLVDVSPEVAVELYVLAEFYMLDRLKSLCEEIVRLKLCHSNAPLLLSVADEMQATSLKMRCTRYIIRHFEVITRSPEFTVLNRDLILEILQSR